ncbi:MAG: HAD-IA family hydrolase [Oscillospiraceae bacterium]|nr:HAD-IA family hydrolase [Oscillospiraceae bacterium]MBR0392431.1 HAD-IA family hydrolase [Oscillospiraceae bacterium]
MIYTTVLFDFDGTVFDTAEGITKSIQYAIRKHGMDYPLEDLLCFVGPPLVEKFMEVFGVEEQEAVTLVEDFRERYLPVGVFESAPFPGIHELLQSLRREGFRVGIATSKPQQLAELLLERAELKKLFDVVIGSDPQVNNNAKWEVITRAMEKLDAKPETTVMVGDTKYDVLGARRCGVSCIGVRWGSAAPGELEDVQADAIAATMDELEKLLMDRRKA